jgi:hypothetical protein
MNAIEVSVNGERHCTAGVEGVRLVNCMAGYFCNKNGSGWGLRVGGMDETEHLNWPVPNIKVGDEITIRIVDAPEVDQPERKPRSTEYPWSRLA